jgi:hypothetical protein
MPHKTGTTIFPAAILLLASLACALPLSFQKPDSSPLGTRQAERTQAADECDLTQYLGSRIEITEKETNQFGTRICSFELYFENQSQQYSAYPMLFDELNDCYQPERKYTWHSPPVIGPGEEASWSGYHHLYTDPDCTGGDSWQRIISAALIKDSAACQDRLGDTSYYESIAVPIYLDCPVED